MAARNDGSEADRPSDDNQDGTRAGEAARKATSKRGEGHVGQALRSAYDDALRETVPDEFLDLLNRLS